MPATKYGIIYTIHTGGVAEWLKAPVSKTGIRVYTRIEGSNPSPSAGKKCSHEKENLMIRVFLWYYLIKSCL